MNPEQCDAFRERFVAASLLCRARWLCYPAAAAADLLAEHGLDRPLFTHSPEGTGKTATIRLLAEEMTEANLVAVVVASAYSGVASALRYVVISSHTTYR